MPAQSNNITGIGKRGEEDGFVDELDEVVEVAFAGIQIV